jgi:hypothetical protein
MFIWLRIDPTVRLRVVCAANRFRSKFLFLFRGSFHTSLLLLGAVRHPLPVYHFPAALPLMLNLSGLYTRCSSPPKPSFPFGLDGVRFRQ